MVIGAGGGRLLYAIGGGGRDTATGVMGVLGFSGSGGGPSEAFSLKGDTGSGLGYASPQLILRFWRRRKKTLRTA